MAGRRIAALVLVGLLAVGLMAGCSYPGKAYLESRAEQRYLDQSVAKLKQQTPMTVIDAHESNGPTPVSVFYGRDQAGKPLAAWVHSGEGVLGYVSLEGGVTREEAKAKIEAAGYQIDIFGPVLVGPEKPSWFAQVRDPSQPNVVQFARVDLRTGALTVKPNN